MSLIIHTYPEFFLNKVNSGTSFYYNQLFIQLKKFKPVIYYDIDNRYELCATGDTILLYHIVLRFLSQVKYKLGRIITFPLFEIFNPPGRDINSNELNCSDIMLVSSDYNKQILNSAGYSNVFRFNYPFNLSYENGKTDNIFTFLCYDNAHWRKATDLLIEAFTKAFGNNKDVRLIISTMGAFPEWQVYYKNLIKTDNIKFYFHGMSGSFIHPLDLYPSHVVVSVTRGEGLGYVPFEGHFKKKIVITSKGTDTCKFPAFEYLGERDSILYVSGKFDYGEDFHGRGGSNKESAIMFHPDMDHYVECLRKAYYNYDQLQNFNYPELNLEEKFLSDIKSVLEV